LEFKVFLADTHGWQLQVSYGTFVLTYDVGGIAHAADLLLQIARGGEPRLDVAPLPQASVTQGLGASMLNAQAQQAMNRNG
jgi:hypothetical protein